MYRRVLAFDFDGTLAENGQVPAALQKTLEQLHMAGCLLFLVTGRRYQSLNLGLLEKVFTGMVWENGAVYHHVATNEVYMPFGYIAPHLTAALEDAGIPLDYGLSIVSTWRAYEDAVMQVLDDQGGGATVMRNKGAVMLLPPGASKGTGLQSLLDICGLSTRNLVSFGDGENDLSMLQISEIGITMANAVLSMKKNADLVTAQPGPAGVLEALERYWLNGSPLDLESQHPRWVPIGDDVREDAPAFLPGVDLVGQNLGIFGGSGSGKSWLAGLIAENLHLSGYQLLLIDPEGNFGGLKMLPRMVVLSGDEKTLASPELVTLLLEQNNVSVVIDLVAYPEESRQAYVTDLIRWLHPLREHKIRPHWIVLEEAQQFISDLDSALVKVLLSLMPGGGWAVISYHPEWLAGPVFHALQHYIVTGFDDPEIAEAVRSLLNAPEDTSMVDIPEMHVLLDDHRLVRLKKGARRVRHVRHLYKYIDMPLPPTKRFYFHDEKGPLDLEAASLYEFKQILTTLPLSSLCYHHRRGDFIKWVRGSLDDQELSESLERLAAQPLTGEALRKALLQRVTARYIDLHAAG